MNVSIRDSDPTDDGMLPVSSLLCAKIVRSAHIDPREEGMLPDRDKKCIYRVSRFVNEPMELGIEPVNLFCVR